MPSQQTEGTPRVAEVERPGTAPGGGTTGAPGAGRRPTSAAEVLDRVATLAPAIAARAAEVEAARRLPPDLLDELVAAGCFHVARPDTHGGIGADLPDVLRVFEAVARADASVGWTVMIGAGSWVDLAGLPRAAFDALFPAAREVITAGAFNPTGTITPAPGGYRVTGRWGFVSGCQHADWIYVNSVEGIEDGVPRLRMAVFPPDEVEIEDTWDVSGLSGTGSHHVHLDDAAVPADMTVVPLTGEPCVDTPIARIPVPSLVALAVASVATGIAQGALDDVVDLALSKVPLLSHGTLATDPLFQAELATADTELRAARALVDECARAAWATASAREPFTERDRARTRAAAAWATDRAAAVAGTAYRAGGGSSIYADSPLQRRRRDVEAVTQHFTVKRGTMRTAGGVLAGQGIDAMVF